MKSYLVLALLFISSYSEEAPLLEEIDRHSRSRVIEKFHQFMEDYERTYDSREEYYHRLAIFQENLLKFQVHNNNPENTFTMGITPFADRRPGEVLGNLKRNKQKSFKLPQKKSEALNHEVDLEMTIDWTQQGVVPPVVDGGDLSDGVNYMMAYSIDSVHAIREGSMQLFSVEELADCTQDMQSAMEFTVSKGIETTEDYLNSPGTGCQYDSTKKQLHVKEWDTLTSEDIVSKMTTKLTSHPIVTVMNAESGQFLYYTGGVISQGCTSQVVLNHALMVVGYDEEGDYWKMQNTWGTTWGENGFVRIKRNQNVCGVETTVFFPVPY